jgi:hypothetical protein
MNQFTHVVVGKVEYREGDGINITIPPGPCEIELTALDATISWTDGDSLGSAAIPVSDYKRHLLNKVLVLAETKMT